MTLENPAPQSYLQLKISNKIEPTASPKPIPNMAADTLSFIVLIFHLQSCTQVQNDDFCTQILKLVLASLICFKSLGGSLHSCKLNVARTILMF